jgi:tRNA pseudouridine55 synthase
VYDATIRFGLETDTGDPTGAPTRAAALPTSARVDSAIAQLTGRIEQMPPAFSAKQVEGVRAYAAARRGEPLTLRPATVVVDAWKILGHRGAELDVTITCGGGTYIRSLARDLGTLSGSAAHLIRLRRTQSGPFLIADAVTLDVIRAGGASIFPARAAVPGLPAERLSDLETQRVTHGQAVPARAEGRRAALVTADGALVAIADRDGDAWHPRLVLRGR